jgi:glutaredoxin
MATVTVVLYGREDCKLCKDAEKKLQLMEVEYEKENIDFFSIPHEGWRDDESTTILAMHCLVNRHIPMLVVNGVPHDYTSAMRAIKSAKKDSDATPG